MLLENTLNKIKINSDLKGGQPLTEKEFPLNVAEHGRPCNSITVPYLYYHYCYH